MKPLDEWNRERAEQYYKHYKYPQLNEIACPKCGHELSDKDALILLSYPPQRTVVCVKCGYIRYRIY